MARRVPTVGARANGNRSIFREKEGGDRYQGVVTRAGAQKFEEARRRLAKIAKRQPRAVSDADTIEYLARGHSDTIAYIVGSEAADK